MSYKGPSAKGVALKINSAAVRSARLARVLKHSDEFQDSTNVIERDKVTFFGRLRPPTFLKEIETCGNPNAEVSNVCFP